MSGKLDSCSRAAGRERCGDRQRSPQMTDLISDHSTGLESNCPAAYQDRAMTVTLPQRQSGQSHSGARCALSSTAGHLKPSSPHRNGNGIVACRQT